MSRIRLPWRHYSSQPLNDNVTYQIPKPTVRRRGRVWTDWEMADEVAKKQRPQAQETQNRHEAAYSFE